MSLRTPICDMLGIEHPVLLAGMGGVSYAEVCAAVSEAGGFGTLGMASATPDQIREQMRKVKSLTDKPFGVDLLAARPESLTDAIDVIIDEGAKAFIAGLGVPFPILEKLKSADIITMNMCGAVRHAIKGEQAGCDAVVAQGSEGGGHTGTVGGMALIPQIVEAVNIPVIAAGAVTDGRGLAAALAFGAQAVWVGTRFIASEEANAHGLYKERIIEAQDRDTVVTRSYSGKTMRVIQNDWTADWESRPGDIRPFGEQGSISVSEGVMHSLMGDTSRFDPNREAAAAGQGSGAVHDVLPAGDIVRNIMAEAEEVIARMNDMANGSFEDTPRHGAQAG
jgi:enoyl-[acyl-carrier protein] reductase II